MPKEYNNSEELKGHILKPLDTINFTIDGVVYFAIVNCHYTNYFLSYDHFNSIVTGLKIISLESFIYKKLKYFESDYSTLIYVENLEDLTKITIELFKMCEKLN